MKTKLLIVLLLQAMEMLADTEVYVGKLCFRCYDETMTAELVKNRFCYNPTDIVVPQEVEADGKTYTVTAIGDKPFWNPVKSVQLPSTIRRIGNEAFQDSELTEIVLPDDIEEIGDYAFYASFDLTKVVFPKNVKQLKIGSHAFSSCWLEELDLPEGLTEIGEGAFDGTQITTLTIPSTVKALRKYCFVDCNNLKTVTIPEGVEYIGTFAFGNTGLESVVIPSTVKEMGAYPFCTSQITSLTIPATLTRWPEGFFTGTKIESIEIPEGVTEIGDRCFQSCDKLKYIKLPSSVKKIGENIVEGCSSLVTLSIPSGVEVMTGAPALPDNATLEITGSDNKLGMENGMLVNDRGEGGKWLLSVPDDAIVDGRFTVPDGITAFGNNLFLDKTELVEIANAGALEHLGSYALSKTGITTVDMPQLKSMGEYTFQKCQSLQHVLLPESIEEIPSECFKGCCLLGEINFPRALKKIGFEAFDGTAIVSAELPDGLEEIGVWAFSDNNLESVTIPASCHKFSYAFAGTNLRQVNIPEGIAEISPAAFASCYNLESINLPSTLKTIGKQAFSYCLGLREIVLPEGLTSVGESAFVASALTSIVIPENVSSLGEWAFSRCSNMTEAVVKSNIKSLPVGIFEECSSLEKVVLPESVECIGVSAFWCDFALSDIKFPSGLKELEYAAMAGCNIEHLQLPSSVKLIGEYCFGDAKCTTVDLSLTQLRELPGHAFNECPNIKSIILPATMEMMTDNFYLCPEIERVECLSAVPPVVEGRTFDEEVFTKAMLVLPEGSEAAYRNAEVWKKFVNISTPTGINSAVIDSKDGERIYDILGRQRDAKTKGVIIKNGKKRIIK